MLVPEDDMVQVHDMLVLEDDMLQVHDMLVLVDDMVQVHDMFQVGEGMKAAELQTKCGASLEHEVAYNRDQSVVAYNQSPWPCCDGGHHELGVCIQSPWPCCDGDGGDHSLDDGEWGGHSPASAALV